MPRRVFYLQQRAGLQRKREDQPINTYLSFYTLCFFHSFFLILPFFSFRFLSQCLIICCDSLLEVTIIVFPPAVHDNGHLYNVYRDRILSFQPLTAFVWFGCTCQPLLVCQSLSHHHLLMLAEPPNKEDYFVCLFTVALLAVTV